MSWDFAVHGKMVFPQNGIEKWLELSLAPEELAPALWPFTEPLDSPMTVHESLCDWDPKQLHVTKNKRTVLYRGYMSKDTMAEVGNRLVASFRAASDVGGRGTLYLIGVANTIAYKITVTKEESTFEKVKDDLEYSTKVSEVLSYPFDKADNPWLNRPAKAPKTASANASNNNKKSTKSK
jgi:hypothetical protein